MVVSGSGGANGKKSGTSDFTSSWKVPISPAIHLMLSDTSPATAYLFLNPVIDIT